MPIRFYCVKCQKLLGIATRKAGEVVTCPACMTRLRVPEPETAPEPSAAPSVVTEPGASVFERSDFEDVWRPERNSALPATLSSGEADDRGGTVAAHPAPEISSPYLEQTDPDLDIRAGVRGRLFSAAIIVLLVAVAFVVGFYLGRSTALQ